MLDLSNTRVNSGSHFEDEEKIIVDILISEKSPWRFSILRIYNIE